MQQKGSERHLEMEGIVCKCEAHGVRRKVSQDREGTGCQSSIHRAFTADLGHMETTDCPISSSDWKRWKLKGVFKAFLLSRANQANHTSQTEQMLTVWGLLYEGIRFVFGLSPALAGAQCFWKGCLCIDALLGEALCQPRSRALPQRDHLQPKDSSSLHRTSWSPFRATDQISGHKHRAASSPWTDRLSSVLNLYLVLLHHA